MPLRELPEIDERRCTSCGDCISVCPTDCLELRDGLPLVATVGRCVSCSLCAYLCPADAVEMKSQFC